jgi:phosphoribosylglycinamide formyltransferase 1
LTAIRDRSLLNLAVDLAEGFDGSLRADALQRIAAEGLQVEERDGADDRTLAWIDLAFGGTWSTEAFRGANVIVRRGDEPVGFATYDPKGLRYRWLRGMGARQGVGIFGPFGLDRRERGRGIGPLLLALALCGLRRRGYEMALIPAVSEGTLAIYYTEHCGAVVVERFDRAAWQTKKYRTAILASGAGTNFAIVAKHVAEGWLPLEIAAVVTNRRSAGVIQRARDAGVHAGVVAWDRDRESRAEFDARLRATVTSCNPDLVLLLGWMHVLDESFVRAFPEILNLHPAFLPLDPARDEVGMPDGNVIPAFRGAHAVRDAVNAHAGWIGSTIHHVTTDADRGPVLMRVPMQLRSDEDADKAFARLRPLEHHMVPRAITAWTYEQ